MMLKILIPIRLLFIIGPFLGVASAMITRDIAGPSAILALFLGVMWGVMWFVLMANQPKNTSARLRKEGAIFKTVDTLGPLLILALVWSCTNWLTNEYFLFGIVGYGIYLSIMINVLYPNPARSPYLNAGEDS